MDLFGKACATGAAFLLVVYVADTLNSDPRPSYGWGGEFFAAALFVFISGAIWL